MEVGLKHNTPFVYLDDRVPEVNWDEVHTDTVRGLTEAKWIKTAVSAGVHKDWADLEMATYYRSAEKHLTPEQYKVYNALESTEQKIKFLCFTTPMVHPFWLCFLRVNKKTEKTQHVNKAVAAECYDTAEMKHFPKLMELIHKLPMKSIGRILIFMTEANNQTVPHYDAANAMQRATMRNADFIWFQPSPAKKLFVMGLDKIRHYPEDGKRFVWFNEMDYHGTEPCPVMSYSVRVEGEFA